MAHQEGCARAEREHQEAAPVHAATSLRSTKRAESACCSALCPALWGYLVVVVPLPVTTLEHIERKNRGDEEVGDVHEVTDPEIHRDARQDRKSTRLNSSHLGISYAVFCLKK